ncbi:hypothetical protein CB1_000509001 [Camelus ferus]|nr:hypothetical protein CB1_000509001 [Camelus ferus]
MRLTAEETPRSQKRSLPLLRAPAAPACHAGSILLAATRWLGSQLPVCQSRSNRHRATVNVCWRWSNLAGSQLQPCSLPEPLRGSKSVGSLVTWEEPMKGLPKIGSAFIMRNNLADLGHTTKEVCIFTRKSSLGRNSYESHEFPKSTNLPSQDVSMEIAPYFLSFGEPTLTSSPASQDRYHKSRTGFYPKALAERARLRRARLIGFVTTEGTG